MSVDDKITKLLEEHGEGAGSDPSGLDVSAEDQLSFLSNIKEKKDSDGPVPDELEPYTKKESAFMHGFYRTLKIAGLLKAAKNKGIGPGMATDANTLPYHGVAWRAKEIAKKMAPKKETKQTTQKSMSSGGQEVRKRKAGPGGATS